MAVDRGPRIAEDTNRLYLGGQDQAVSTPASQANCRNLRADVEQRRVQEQRFVCRVGQLHSGPDAAAVSCQVELGDAGEGRTVLDAPTAHVFVQGLRLVD